MIIDDCNAINFLIGTVLKKDFNISSAKNSADAMDQLQSDLNKDLIILNISDENCDNYELLEHIASSSVVNDIQRVVISDSDDEELKFKTAELGADVYKRQTQGYCLKYSRMAWKSKNW